MIISELEKLAKHKLAVLVPADSLLQLLRKAHYVGYANLDELGGDQLSRLLLLCEETLENTRG